MTKLRSIVDFFFERLILSHPLIVIICMLAALFISGLGARNFKLDASEDTLVLEGDEDLRYSRMINTRYGKQDFLILAFTPKGELFSDRTLSELKSLRDDMEALKNVSSVVFILDVPLFESPPVSPKELKDQLPTLFSQRTDRNMARLEFRDSPIYRNLLVSSDLRTTALLVYFPEDKVYNELAARRDMLRHKKQADSLTPEEHAKLNSIVEQLEKHNDEMKRQRHQDILAIRKIMDKYRDAGDVFLGGISMIADDMITFIKNDLKTFGIGVMIFLIITLGIIFRKIRWVLLPMLCCVVSVMYMIGLLGWLGWKVTVVSSNFISLQLIMTMALTIHLIVRYRELLTQKPEAPNRELIFDTVRLMLKPCWYTVITTIAGFGSLVFCDMLPVIMFGWMMMLGLIVSLIVTFLLFPSVLMMLPKEHPPPPLKSCFAPTAIMARLTESNSMFILITCGLVFIVSLMGIARLKVENSFINYFHKSTEIYQGMKVIDEKLGGTTSLDVIIDFGQPTEDQADAEPVENADDDVFAEFDEYEDAAEREKYWFTADKIGRIESVHNYLESLPETGKVLSLATMVNVAEKLNKGKPLDSFELALLYNETPEKFKDLLIEPYVSIKNDQVRFWMRVKDSQPSLRRNELLKKIRNDLTGKLGFDEKQVHLTGLLVLYNNMLQNLFDSQIVTFGLTVLTLMLMFLILFRSLKICIVALVPNALPVLVMLGVMGWLGIPLDMMTITIAAISLGIAVDDTIHYIHRFKREFEHDHKYLNTMRRCHGSIGHAMCYTSITIIIGFSILVLSNFIPTVYFGLLTGLVMAIAIFAALTFLPVMLILTKPFGKENKID